MKKGNLKKILALTSMGVMALSMPIVLTGCSSDDQFNVRVEGDYVQWQKTGDENWNNLLSVDAIKDMLGEAYKGDKGEQGNPGVDGREVEFRAANGYVQWRYVGEDSWKNLVTLGQLTPDFDSYITVHNLNTEFLVNEELNLSNAYLKYYTSEENYDIVKITEDMIAWQGTAVAGEYEMMVIYNGKAETLEYNVYDVYSIVEKAVENSIAKGSVKVDIDQVAGAEIYLILKTDCGYYYNHGEYEEELDEKMVQEGWSFANPTDGFTSYHLTKYDGEIDEATKAPRAVDDIYLIGNYFNQYTYIYSEEYSSQAEEYGDKVEFDLVRNADNSFSAICKVIYSETSYEIISVNIKNGLIDSVSFISYEIDGVVETIDFSENSEYIYNDFAIPELPEGIDWEIVSGEL